MPSNTEKESIKLCSARKLNIDVNSISDIKIHKRSIDARSPQNKDSLKSYRVHQGK